MSPRLSGDPDVARVKAVKKAAGDVKRAQYALRDVLLNIPPEERPMYVSLVQLREGIEDPLLCSGEPTA